MSPFDLAQSLIEQCRCRAGPDLAAVLQRTLEALGFRYFACCSHVDPLHPPRGAVMLHTYPPVWARAFHEHGLHEFDPVFRYVSRTLAPFFWDETVLRAELSLQERECLAEAGQLGIVHGYTVPIHAPLATRAFRASCSVVPDSATVPSSSYCAVQLMSCFVYETASREGHPDGERVRTLTRRERQCLELVARGKSDWETSVILQLSERTVHCHIESAKRRLGVATRMQAVVHALHSGQIGFGDVIRPRPSQQD